MLEKTVKFPNTSLLVLIAVLALAVIRVFFIDNSSLWYDELHTAVATAPNVSWDQFWQKWIIPDVHPPLFYLVIYSWQHLGFSSDFLLRLWPFVFSLLFIPFVWRLQKDLIGKRAFPWYLLLITCSPFVIYYSTELRSYSLLYCLAVIATVFFHRITNSTVVRLSDAVGLAISAGLMALTHYFSCYFILAIYLVLVYQFHSNIKFCLRFLLPAIVFGLPAMLWFVFHFSSLSARAGGEFWISNNPGSFILFFVYQFAGGFLGALVIVVGLISALLLGKRQHKNRYLFTALLGLLLAVMVSIHTPMITPRNLLVFVPLILVWLAEIFDGIETRHAKLFCCSLLILLMAQSLYLLTSSNKQDWRGATSYVEAITPDNCPIPYEHKFDPYMRIHTKHLYEYYFKPEYKKRLVKGPVNIPSCPVLLMAGQSDWAKVEKELNSLKVKYQEKDFRFVRVYIKP